MLAVFGILVRILVLVVGVGVAVVFVIVVEKEMTRAVHREIRGSQKACREPEVLAVSRSGVIVIF